MDLGARHAGDAAVLAQVRRGGAGSTPGGCLVAGACPGLEVGARPT